MVSSKLYDLMYRIGAPWDSVGVRPELQALLASRVVSPTTHPRAIDLGCGTGANVVFLQEQGFTAMGVDSSTVAIAKATERAEAAGRRPEGSFVVGDLTAQAVDGVDGTFDLLLDFGTLDDLRGAARRAMVRTIVRWSHAGSVVLFWCFYGPREELPWISFHGPSRLAAGLVPGEEHDLFGDHFDIERQPSPPPGSGAACFVLERRGTATR